MTYADIWNTSQKRLLNIVQEMGIVRFVLLSEKYGVKILITSFWDTQYIYSMKGEIVTILHCSIWCHSIANFTRDVGNVIMNKISKNKNKDFDYLKYSLRK